MRVLCLANHFNTGGITSYLMTLARGLQNQGHHVVIASAGGDRVGDLEDAAIRHVRVPLRVKCSLHPVIFLSLPRLVRLIRKEKIGIIHVHTRSTQMCAAMLAGLTGVPVVSTGHGFFRPHWGRRILPLWGRAVIAISPQVAEHLVRDLGVQKDRVAVIRNGIELERFRPGDDAFRREARKKRGVADVFVIGIVARLSDVKGHRYLIEAMPLILKACPDLQCLIVGDGPEEGRLKEQVRQAGLSGSVHFLPVVNRTAEVLPLLDLFILPSLQEGLGLSAMEAAACGVPVIASRVGGIPQVIKDGETGILVPPCDPEALARAVITLATDPASRLGMGKKARDLAAQNFSADIMVRDTIAVYQKVLG